MLMEGLDIAFEQRVIPDIDESFPSDLPHPDIPIYISKQKAKAYIPTLKEDELLITADTVVLLNNRVLGKPHNQEEARSMLASLSNNIHTVVTGVCFSRCMGIIHTIAAESKVHFGKLSPEEINYYINQYKPFDKAGAYGIQEWIGYVAIHQIEGSFYNVMGLPIHQIYQTLRNWCDIEKNIVPLPSE